MSEFLLAKGYEVHGVGKPGSESSKATDERVELHAVDLTEPVAVRELLAQTQPDEIYNFAAPSVVGASWNDPPATLRFLTGSVVALLDAIVAERPGARFFQASSSELFRGAGVTPQNELTPPRPTSPYGVGKLAGHALVHAYRKKHGVHASSGILYNHESPRRPVDFVPSKIVHAAVQIKLGNQRELVLGDRSARRDWGYAGDYVKAMWLMLQQNEPDDFVIATGRTHSVDDLVQAAFSLAGVDVETHVKTDPRLVRSDDEAQLVGDPSKIAERLGWSAETSFNELVRIMYEGALDAALAGAPQLTE